MGPTGATAPTGIFQIDGTAPVLVATATTTPVLSIDTATATASGVVSAASQTFAGVKTFNDGITIGSSGSTITKVVIVAVTWNIPNTNANTIVEQARAVTGAAVGNPIICRPNSGTNANFLFSCWVSSAGNVMFRGWNVSNASVNPGNTAFTVMIYQ